MVPRTRPDARYNRTAASALLVCAVLAGCDSERPYPDDSDLPRATYYTVVVRPGDTLSEIARRYDARVDDVAELNRIGDESRIAPGLTLRIPANGEETRKAVLGEAGGTSRNYAPPPKPIDIGRFDARDRVTVHNLAPISAENGSSAYDAADGRMQHTNVVPTPRPSEQEDSGYRGGQFAWPVVGQVISPFGWVGRGERNEGINIAADSGTPIRAAAAGTITYVGDELKGYGNLVLIQHDDGYITAYAHAQSISVNRGDHVRKGQIIARAGATGDVDRPQLHFEIRKGAQPINPRLLLASRD
jgi:murein DD-endopeptidase MepM/ murein hydrolase activator NlpD